MLKYIATVELKEYKKRYDTFKNFRRKLTLNFKFYGIH